MVCVETTQGVCDGVGSRPTPLATSDCLLLHKIVQARQDGHIFGVHAAVEAVSFPQFPCTDLLERDGAQYTGGNRRGEHGGQNVVAGMARIGALRLTNTQIAVAGRTLSPDN